MGARLEAVASAEQEPPVPQPGGAKRLLKAVSPAYRVALRAETQAQAQHAELLAAVNALRADLAELSAAREDTGKVHKSVIDSYLEIQALRQELAAVRASVLDTYTEVQAARGEGQALSSAINHAWSETQVARDEIRALTALERLHIWLGRPEFPSDIDAVKREFWKGLPPAVGVLRTVQEANAALLGAFSRVCAEAGVVFWLHGGSLVGGLRHAGFIPWDDDIDTAMTRTDFAKLLAHLEGSDTYTVTRSYYATLSSIAYRFTRKDIESNCFVDIFIYDHYVRVADTVAEDWERLKQYNESFRLQYHELLREYGLYPFDQRLGDYPELEERLAKIVANYAENLGSDTETGWISWGMENNYENPYRPAWKLGRVFPTSDITPFRTCVFEGVECNVPREAEAYARHEYGIGYLEIPGDVGDPVHLASYFATEEDLAAARAILAAETG
jgi:phosphorylcholine metabolism protein LicD